MVVRNLTNSMLLQGEKTKQSLLGKKNYQNNMTQSSERNLRDFCTPSHTDDR